MEQLTGKLEEVEAAAKGKIATAEEAREKAIEQALSQEAELSSLQKRLKEAEQANARQASDFVAQKEKQDGKVHNQRQVGLLFTPSPRLLSFRDMSRIVALFR